MGGWREFALCAEVAPEIFFPEASKPVTPAKTICMACEVREQCLRYALRTGQEFGVWGGTSVVERRKMSRELGYEQDEEAA